MGAGGKSAWLLLVPVGKLDLGSFSSDLVTAVRGEVFLVHNCHDCMQEPNSLPL